GLVMDTSWTFETADPWLGSSSVGPSHCSDDLAKSQRRLSPSRIPVNVIFVAMTRALSRLRHGASDRVAEHSFGCMAEYAPCQRVIVTNVAAHRGTPTGPASRVRGRDGFVLPWESSRC